MAVSCLYYIYQLILSTVEAMTHAKKKNVFYLQETPEFFICYYDYFICYYDYSVVYWFFATSCLIIRMFLVTRCVVLSKFLWQSHVFTKYINSEYCRSNDARKKKRFSFTRNTWVFLLTLAFCSRTFLRDFLPLLSCG